MVTIKQVAAHAGVSFKTVSRVVNNDPTVKSVNRDKVLASIEALGYQPNIAARLVRQKQSNVIAFISNQITTTATSVEILRGAQQRASELGKSLVVINQEEGEQGLIKAFQTCLQHRAESIVYGANYHQAIALPECFGKIPTVMVNCFDPNKPACAIVPDDQQAAYQITRMLTAKGYKRIAFLNLNPQAIAAKLRQQGVEAAIEEARSEGVEIDLDIQAIEDIVDGELVDNTRDITETILRDFKPDAILCGKDWVAVQVYFVLAQHNLSIPADVGVASFDNWDCIPQILQPNLSSMALPYFQMGETAVDKLTQQQLEDSIEKLGCRAHLRQSF